MASRSVGKGAKKLAQIKVEHPPYLKTNIRAGMAAPAPPLGPQVGARNIQIGPVVKQFNEMTKHIKPGIPIPTMIYCNPDRSFEIVTYTPPVNYFLKKATGMKRGSPKATEIMGRISLKHVYEIAKIKSADPPHRNTPLIEICKQIIGTSHTCGVEVVKHIDPEEYKTFLEERDQKEEEFEQQLQEARQAKLLRL